MLRRHASGLMTLPRCCLPSSLSCAPVLGREGGDALISRIFTSLTWIWETWNAEFSALAYQIIPGWTFDDNLYGSSGPPYDLTPHVIQVEINDVDESGTISVSPEDTITLDDVPQQIGLMYYGYRRRRRRDGTERQLLCWTR